MVSRPRPAGAGSWSGSAAIALALDAVLGDAPLRPHPVAVFGSAMNRLEQRMWADRHTAGLGYALAGVLGAAGAGWLLEALPGGPAMAGYAAIAGRGLWSAARDVGDALGRDDLALARELLPSLVGRDSSGLQEPEIVRAAVESVAENTVDAIVAPALFLAHCGARGVLAYRAVNTLDAMVGHRSARYRRFGWASARADDLANLLPARCTAALVACVRPARAGAVWRAVRHDATAHPSPNAGVVEAAFAAALGLRLGGESRYGESLETRPLLHAAGRSPERADIEATVKLSEQVTALLGAVLAVLGAVRPACGRLRRS